MSGETLKHIKTGIKCIEVDGKHFISAEYVIALEDLALKVAEHGVENCDKTPAHCDTRCTGCDWKELRDMIRESIRVNTESGVRK